MSVQVSPIYDLVLVLLAATHPRRHEVARGWAAGLERRLDPSDVRLWRSLFGGQVTLGLQPLTLVPQLITPPQTDDARPTDSHIEPSVETFLTLLESLAPEQVALAFLPYVALDNRDVEAIRRRASGAVLAEHHEESLAQLQARLPVALRLPWRTILHDPESVRRDYHTLLTHLHERFFAVEWPHLQAGLHDAQAEYQARWHVDGLAGLLSSALAELILTPADLASDMVIIPSHYAFPLRFLLRPARIPGSNPATLAIVGKRTVVTDDPRRGAQPRVSITPDADDDASHNTLDSVSLLKALADRTRLRLLELIAERPRYAQELADLLAVRPPTITHHLAILRRAGLIRAETQDGTAYYYPQVPRLDNLISDLTTRLRLNS